MKYMRLSFLMTLVFIGQIIFAQNTQFSLKEAVEYGYSNHPDMEIAQNELEKAKQQLVEARSMGLPQVNAGVDYNYYIKLPTSLIPAQFLNPMAPDGEFIELSFGTKNNLTASGTLSSLLFDGGYLLALKASRKYIDFSKMNYQDSRASLRNSIKKAYLPPLLLQENINIVEKNIGVLQKLYDETNEMYKAGFVEKMDVDKLYLTVDNMRVLKKDLEKNKLLAMDALKVQMGYPLDQEIELTENIEDLSSEFDREMITREMDYSNRTEFKTLNYAEELSELNVEQFKRGYWPSLSGFVTYQQVVQGDDLFNGAISTPTSLAGLSLKVPIFDGLFKSAKIQQAKLELENVSFQKNLLKSGIDLQLKAARENYLNALQNIKSRKKNLDLAEEIFETTQVKYKEGVGSSLEIIQAEQSLHDSQQNYLNSLYEFVVAKIDVEVAMGIE